jgi:hypothetical protein
MRAVGFGVAVEQLPAGRKLPEVGSQPLEAEGLKFVQALQLWPPTNHPV